MKSSVYHEPAVFELKAKLARRRSHLVWPGTAFLGLQENVRLEARLALYQSISDYWPIYRRSEEPGHRARIRSFLRAKITAIRILKPCV